MRAVYTAAGLAEPLEVEWAESPLVWLIKTIQAGIREKKSEDLTWIKFAHDMSEYDSAYHVQKDLADLADEAMLETGYQDWTLHRSLHRAIPVSMVDYRLTAEFNRIGRALTRATGGAAYQRAVDFPDGNIHATIRVWLLQLVQAAGLGWDAPYLHHYGEVKDEALVQRLCDCIQEITPPITRFDTSSVSRSPSGVTPFGRKAPITLFDSCSVSRSYSQALRNRVELLAESKPHCFDTLRRHAVMSSLGNALDGILRVDIGPPRRLRRAQVTLAQEALAVSFHRDVAVLCEHPCLVSVDGAGRLHSAGGPAICFADGCGPYAWHGRLIPTDIAENPGSLTIEQIDSMRNVEVRRCLIEMYGDERYLRDAGAKLIQEDAFGQLYHRGYQDDEPLVMLSVVNSTPEPDGSYKRYFLQVPPNMTRAREAVAWTFGMLESDYCPLVET